MKLKTMPELLKQYVDLGVAEWVEDHAIKCTYTGVIIRHRPDLPGLPAKEKNET